MQAEELEKEHGPLVPFKAIPRDPRTSQEAPFLEVHIFPSGDTLGTWPLTVDCGDTHTNQRRLSSTHFIL